MVVVADNQRCPTPIPTSLPTMSFAPSAVPTFAPTGVVIDWIFISWVTGASLLGFVVCLYMSRGLFKFCKDPQKGLLVMRTKYRNRFGGRNWSNADAPDAEDGERDSDIGYGEMGRSTTVGAGVLNPVADETGASPPPDPREATDGGL
mmetsp:Transcript_29147/g.50287  ORF Transcript_29147/g.50287 Transcript_29147/m.50287 type:complete len:148 (+) Transcript_29147:248-691(+)